MTSKKKRKREKKKPLLTFCDIVFFFCLLDCLTFCRDHCACFPHSVHRNTMSGVSSGVAGGSATAMSLAASRAAIQQRQRDNCVQKLAKLFADLHSKFVPSPPLTNLFHNVV